MSYAHNTAQEIPNCSCKYLPLLSFAGLYIINWAPLTLGYGRANRLVQDSTVKKRTLRQRKFKMLDVT